MLCLDPERNFLTESGYPCRGKGTALRGFLEGTVGWWIFVVKKVVAFRGGEYDRRRQLPVVAWSWGARWLDYDQAVCCPTPRDAPWHDHVMFAGVSDIVGGLWVKCSLFFCKHERGYMAICITCNWMTTQYVWNFTLTSSVLVIKCGQILMRDRFEFEPDGPYKIKKINFT